MQKEFKTVDEFYPFYLSEHANPINRSLHFIGTAVSLLLLLYLVITAQFMKLPFLLFIGYGFAWFGHFVFEKNRPATFKYPYYSLVCDFKMFFDIIRGRVKISA